MSRAELIQIAQELNIDWQGLSIEELKSEIRKAADKKFKNKKYLHSTANLSDTLCKFLTKEYDFVVRGKNGKKIEVKV